MDFKYKFILKKIVCNKLRNIYIRVNSKSKKQYLKYKGEMINIKEYKSNFKNINKKKYKKIKGGGNEFETFINDINKIIYPLPDAPAAMSDAPEKPDPLIQFHKAYLKFVDKWEEELDKNKLDKNQLDEHYLDKKKEEKNLNFLTTLLKYLGDNFNKLEHDYERNEYILLLNKLSTLLFILDQQGETGIHKYNNDPNSRIAYVSNKSEYFDKIISVINNFREKYKKIAWTKFQKNRILDKINIKKEEITISNSAVYELIKKMISNEGLDAYNPNHNTLSARNYSARNYSARNYSAKPYSRPVSAISKTGKLSSKP
tara:strand:+ start:292 stop:1236 length:945 start_codon:yes stop_codon:yes gene_type:complete